MRKTKEVLWGVVLSGKEDEHYYGICHVKRNKDVANQYIIDKAEEASDSGYELKLCEIHIKGVKYVD